MNVQPHASALVEGAARIVLRPIGNPLPLGFLALAGATLIVSLLGALAALARRALEDLGKLGVASARETRVGAGNETGLLPVV